MFKKKIPVWALIVSLLLAILITFQVTFVLTVKRQDDKRASTGVEESAGSRDFIERVTRKLTEYDAQFRKNYIGEIDDDALIDSVLKGYAEGTGDKYADYYNKEDYKEYLAEMTGETEGIGVNVIYNEEYRCIEVVTVFPDSPAQDAGLLPGDLIVYVGEEKTPVSELGYYPAIAKLRGKSGTEAVFTVFRGDDYAEEWAEDGDRQIRVMEWHALKAAFVCDADGNLIELDNLSMDEDLLTGPRGLTVGDTLDVVLGRFRYEATEVGGFHTWLYGTEGEGDYAVMDSQYPGEADLHYATVVDGLKVEMLLYVTKGALQSIVLQIVH